MSTTYTAHTERILGELKRWSRVIEDRRLAFTPEEKERNREIAKQAAERSGITNPAKRFYDPKIRIV